jgi:hypothetical protein
MPYLGHFRISTQLKFILRAKLLLTKDSERNQIQFYAQCSLDKYPLFGGYENSGK